MIKQYSLVGLALAVACFSVGCGRSGDGELLRVALRADPVTAEKVEAVLEENPEIAASGTQATYTLEVVEPGADVEWTLLQVVPDDDLGYAIVFIDPATGEELPDLSDQLAPGLRDRFLSE